MQSYWDLSEINRPSLHVFCEILLQGTQIKSHCLLRMGGRHRVCGYSLGLKTTHLTDQHMKKEGRTLIPLENILNRE